MPFLSEANPLQFPNMKHPAAGRFSSTREELEHRKETQSKEQEMNAKLTQTTYTSSQDSHQSKTNPSEKLTKKSSQKLFFFLKQSEKKPKTRRNTTKKN
jgi:hypothetical protein